MLSKTSYEKLKNFSYVQACTKFVLYPFFFKHQHQHYQSESLSSSVTPLSGPEKATALAEALAVSANSKSCTLGTQIHGCAFKLGFSNDSFSQNYLIKMYIGCGVLADGFKVFAEMPRRNLVSWTLIISGATGSGDYEMALEVYLNLTRTGLMPNEFALGSILKVCALVRACMLGMCVHSSALKIGMENNPYVGSSMLHMYAKCGVIEAARRIFEGLNIFDVGCWNAMVGAYAQSGCGFEAIKTVSLMHHKGMVMDKFTFIGALKGSSAMYDLNFGRQIHGLIVRSKMIPSTSVMNALLDMYFKNAETDCAFKIFDEMQERDIVSWNTVFSGSFQFLDVREVANLFKSFMLTSLKPNHVTFSILFRLCGNLFDLDLGFQLFSLAFHFGFCDEVHVANSLISMFSKCGAMKMAHLVFDSVPSISTDKISGCNLKYGRQALQLFCYSWELGIEANEYTFSSALEACFISENLQLSRQIHGILVKTGFVSYGYVCSSLVKVYVKLKLLEDAFNFLCELDKVDIISWSTMISALVQNGYISEGVKILNFLKEAGGQPDEFILGSILNGCARSASDHLTKSIHSFIMKTGHGANTYVTSAIIDAYAKCGDIESAEMAFDQSTKSSDVIIFNTMIMAYAHHGFVSKAMELFEKMKVENLKPNHATFVSVLSACSHMGLVDQGHTLFKSMALDYGMEPSPGNYGCLVDLLSRNGFLQDARQIIEAMPFPPWPAILRSLLNGCRIHGDRELGEWATKKLLQLVPENDAAYLLLSNVYSEYGNWEAADRLRTDMKDRGVRKDTGYSWVFI
ncbi:hypothetical protein NMG60_11008305 [Bertholletia excelsa]